jgi:23S rRNA (adenine1618-N6)-methyltransferase
MRHLTDTHLAKGSLHPRNLHQNRYDLAALVSVSPELASHIFVNKYGVETIDFSIDESVKQLNKALLIKYYNIQYWDLPNGFLCPPVPGRADYIHYIADLISYTTRTDNITCLDIGVGANCIYPIIGRYVYGWNFVCSDIDVTAIKNAENIINQNDILSGKVICRIQPNTAIFQDIILPGECYAVTICNPPFHAAKTDAIKATNRKVYNLTRADRNNNSPKLNFGGQANELWVEGGEKGFIIKMINESWEYRSQVEWFTSLVSKQENLPALLNLLKSKNAKEIKTVNMSQGQKTSRFIAWRWV